MDLENNWVSFTITRGPIRGKNKDRVGLLVQVQARRDVEEFMSGLCKGRRTPVDSVGGSWQNCNPSGDALEFYESGTPLDGHRVYTLEGIGEPPLMNPYERNERQIRAGIAPAQQEELVNLSFLRIAGISNDSGVTIGIFGAFSNDYLKRLKLALPGAIKQFLQDYVVPVTINLQVVSKS